MKFIGSIFAIVLSVLVPSIILHFGVQLLLGVNLDIFGLALILIGIVTARNLLSKED